MAVGPALYFLARAPFLPMVRALGRCCLAWASCLLSCLLEVSTHSQTKVLGLAVVLRILHCLGELSCLEAEQHYQARGLHLEVVAHFLAREPVLWHQVKV